MRDHPLSLVGDVVSMAVDMLPYVSTSVNMMSMKLLQEIDASAPVAVRAFGRAGPRPWRPPSRPSPTRQAPSVEPDRFLPGLRACGCDLTTPVGLSQTNGEPSPEGAPQAGSWTGAPRQVVYFRSGRSRSPRPSALSG